MDVKSRLLRRRRKKFSSYRRADAHRLRSETGAHQTQLRPFIPGAVPIYQQKNGQSREACPIIHVANQMLYDLKDRQKKLFYKADYATYILRGKFFASQHA